jgi:hypothetical protein
MPHALASILASFAVTLLLVVHGRALDRMLTLATHHVSKMRSFPSQKTTTHRPAQGRSQPLQSQLRQRGMQDAEGKTEPSIF